MDSIDRRLATIASGQHSVFFAHHADYAAVTSGVATPNSAQAFDRGMVITDVRVLEKKGGKSGHWVAP